MALLQDPWVAWKFEVQQLHGAKDSLSRGDYEEAYKTAYSVLQKGGLPLPLRIESHVILATPGFGPKRMTEKHLDFLHHAQRSVNLISEYESQTAHKVPQKLVDKAHILLQSAKYADQQRRVTGPTGGSPASSKPTRLSDQCQARENEAATRVEEKSALADEEDWTLV